MCDQLSLILTFSHLGHAFIQSGLQVQSKRKKQNQEKDIESKVSLLSGWKVAEDFNFQRSTVYHSVSGK